MWPLAPSRQGPAPPDAGVRLHARRRNTNSKTPRDRSPFRFPPLIPVQALACRRRARTRNLKTCSQARNARHWVVVAALARHPTHAFLTRGVHGATVAALMAPHVHVHARACTRASVHRTKTHAQLHCATRHGSLATPQPAGHRARPRQLDRHGVQTKEYIFHTSRIRRAGHGMVVCMRSAPYGCASRLVRLRRRAGRRTSLTRPGPLACVRIHRMRLTASHGLAPLTSPALPCIVVRVSSFL